jgi:hypothetical protein
MRCYFLIYLIDMLLLHVCGRACSQIIRVNFGFLTIITCNVVLNGRDKLILRVTKFGEAASAGAAVCLDLAEGQRNAAVSELE